MNDTYHPQLEIPAIEPVPEGVERPFWSVMVPTYNDRGFLKIALQSILANDPGPEQMQIQVVDDLPGGTTAQKLIEELAPGRIEYFQNPQNLGHVGTFTQCVRRSRGQWVHVIHDDDIVYSGFYRALRQGVEKFPQAGAAFCRVQNIDEAGKKLNLTPEELPEAGIFQGLPYRLARGNPVLFPGMVVKRSSYEQVGGFTDLEFTADWVMWMRVAVKFPVFYDPRPLAGYRRHAGSDTSRLVRVGGDIKGLHRALRVFGDLLPDTPAVKTLLHHSREHMATVGVHSARQLAQRGDLFAASAQLREALACCSSPRVLREMEDGGAVRHFATFLKQLGDHAQHHKVTLNPGASLAPLREARLLIARQWTEFGPDQTDDLLAGEFGQATATLLGSSIRDEPLDEADQKFVDVLRTDLADTAAPAYGQRVLAALLMAHPWDWPAVDFMQLTGPVLGTYLRDALQIPVALATDEKLGAYVDFLADLLARVRRLVQSEADPQLRLDVAALVTNGLNLLVPRSTGRDLSQLLVDRAAIVEHALSGAGVKAAHAFGPPRPTDARRRVAILTNALGTNRDTFEALPCFELDRGRLHVTAYAAAAGDAAIEKLVGEKVDRFIVLSGDLAEQVRTIRGENYDAMLIAADVTVSAAPAAVLSHARLCRRQIATDSYGLKGGLVASIDEVWQGECFRIPPGVGAASIWPAREQLGLRADPIVFMSAANALRITPAVRRMWAAILRDVPGSRLVLLPYSPQWGVGEYQGVPFVRAMNAALTAEQVDPNRMIVVNPLPHRQDVLAVLKLADVYLDAFPESGGLSIYDALEAGLPPVTMGSEIFRQVNGPVAESEQAYHDLAVKYANQPEERDKLRESVRAATVTAPPFLDVAAFGNRLSNFLAANNV